MKKIVSALICAMLLLSIASPVFATEGMSSVNMAMPRYSCIDTVDVTLFISGNTANVNGFISKTPLAKSAKITCTLQRQAGGTWLSLKSWTNTSSSPVVSVSGSTGITSGTFRVMTTYSATSPNGTESGTIYSTEEIL